MQPSAKTSERLEVAALALAEQLKANDQRIVFAESCTAGLVSATLAGVPGISQHLCGSAVTYRNDTKIQWLEVTQNAIAHAGVVSAVVARQMAAGVLQVTPEADLAVAITGHLGPNAPENLDGVIFVGTATRAAEPTATKHTLPADVADDQVRIERQYLAATIVLETASKALVEHG